MVHVVEVVLAERYVILSDHRQAPITNLFRRGGEETTCHLEDVVTGVAKAGEDEWYAFEILPRERVQ